MSGCRPRIPRGGHTGHTRQTFFVSAKKCIYIFLADLTLENCVQPVQNHAIPCGTKDTSGLTGFFWRLNTCLPDSLSCPVRFSRHKKKGREWHDLSVFPDYLFAVVGIKYPIAFVYGRRYIHFFSFFLAVEAFAYRV